MHAQARFRAVVTALLSLALAGPVLGVSATAVHAGSTPASQEIVFSEINWAGSANTPNDEWVELYNTTNNAIDLTKYQVLANTNVVVTFPAGAAIQPHRTYLIGRMSAGTSPTLSGFGTPDLYDASLLLPNKDVQYVLQKTATQELVDRADDGLGAPLAGSNGAVGGVISSMSRVFPLSDGSLSVAWTTPSTIGAGFTQNTVQYGTPTNAAAFVESTAPNPTVAVPSSLTVSPLSPVTAPAVPTISGIAPLNAQNVSIHFQQFGGTQVIDTLAGVNPVTGAFTATVSLPIAGAYSIEVFARDIVGNRSATVRVPIAGSPQAVYVVNPPASLTVSPPKINKTYPTLVNTPTVTLTGTSEPGTLVISLNGKNYGNEQLTGGQTTFSLSVTLVPNSVNTIEVRAVNAAGHISEPDIATITHDGIAPAALGRNLVTLHANPAGTADTVSGLAGAAEANATVVAYSDSALLHVIGSGLVAADGSFGPIAIGDDAAQTVYLVVKDQAGNSDSSTVLALANITSFGSTPITINFSITNITQNQATLTWQPVPGAVAYRLKYKLANGQFSNPVELCMSASDCTLHRTLVNLQSGSGYVIALAAVDSFGHESTYTEVAFSTATASTAPAVTTAVVTYVVPPAGNKAAVPYSSGAVSQAQVTPAPSSPPTPTPSATAEPSPSASPEQGQVKSLDTASGRNYTPWIILGVLLLLALLATLAYFYWFGGETVDDAANVVVTKREDRTSSTKNDIADSNSGKTPEKPIEKPDREKRW